MKHVFFAIALICFLNQASNAQGISFTESDGASIKKSEDSRFTVIPDKLMGAVVRDKKQKIEFMRCSVGQTYNASAESELEKCNDRAQDITYEQAQSVIKKAQGWRLPTIVEFENIMSEDGRFYVSKFLKNHAGSSDLGSKNFWTSNTFSDSQYRNVCIGGYSPTSGIQIKNHGHAYAVINGSSCNVRLVRNIK